MLLVSIVPLGVFAAGLLYVHWQAQERERVRSQLESVRLIAAAVDNALDSTIQRLGIFARVWAASGASDSAIHAQAVEALAANPDWINIIAFRADGAGVFRADEPFGATVPRMRLLDLWRPAMQRKQPYVTDVIQTPSTGARIVAVGVPVVRGGRTTHLLIATLNGRWFDNLLNKQGFPPGAVSGVFDRNFMFVARSREGDERRGTNAAPQLVADMQARAEGIGKYTSLNGISVYTSWTATKHGWWAAFATPSAPVDAAFWKHLGVLAAFWVLAVAAGLAFALRKSRRIAASLASIETHAADLAQGRRIEASKDRSDVHEMILAVSALEQASEALQQAMRQRDESLETERVARGAAEAANRAKDEFLAMLGHELRNPLAAIGHAAAIVRGAAAPDQLAYAAGVISRQTQHLKRLIDDLLDVGRVMNGKILLQHAPLDLASAVRHATATAEAAGSLRDRRLTLELEPVWIDGDATRIEQIVTNLVVNAAAYTPPGGRIGVRTARDGAHAVLEVTDDGRGIAAGELERVFELFYQAEATVDRSRGGLGIGLTLVQRLAELHGGSVRAASEGLGKGATFTVRFPAAAQAHGRADLALVSGVSRTLLLVEDNADERGSLRMLLEMNGHRVLEAADGAAALEVLRREQPPVAIVDIGLPGMDGYEVARAARRDLGGGIVLIALTGYGAEADAQRALNAGFDRHVSKPVSLNELMRAISSAASRASKAA